MRLKIIRAIHKITDFHYLVWNTNACKKKKKKMCKKKALWKRHFKKIDLFTVLIGAFYNFFEKDLNKMCDAKQRFSIFVL